MDVLYFQSVLFINFLLLIEVQPSLCKLVYVDEIAGRGINSFLCMFFFDSFYYWLTFLNEGSKEARQHIFSILVLSLIRLDFLWLLSSLVCPCFFSITQTDSLWSFGLSF